jgi:hypothetical protein
MPILVALPGLVLALIAFTGPLWMRLPIYPAHKNFEWLPKSMPWLRSAGLLYVAVVFGWVSMRDAGILGQTAEEWLAGALFALVCGGVGGWLSKRYAVEMPLANWVQDEIRWTFYRAVVWPVVVLLPVAVPVALIVAFLEWRLEEALLGHAWDWNQTAPWLVRAVFSSLLFLLAHNLWLALAMYLAAHLARIANFSFARSTRKP